MDIVLRASFMFFMVFGLLRLLGKRELAEMTPFELLLLVVMGDLLQQGVTHNDFSLTGASLAIITFAFWSLVLGFVATRSRSAERVLDGSPAVLVRHGEILHAAVRHNRLTMSELESEMRLAGIGHFEQVDWAILETNGKISFIKMDAGKATRAQDQSVAA
jgi:uncharacterized membrane protein YcaP (DUF421 family)